MRLQLVVEEDRAEGNRTNRGVQIDVGLGPEEWDTNEAAGSEDGRPDQRVAHRRGFVRHELPRKRRAPTLRFGLGRALAPPMPAECTGAYDRPGHHHDQSDGPRRFGQPHEIEYLGGDFEHDHTRFPPEVFEQSGDAAEYPESARDRHV